MLLGYLGTYTNTQIRYIALETILHLDYDTARLVAPKARSRVAGYLYCGGAYTDK